MKEKEEAKRIIELYLSVSDKCDCIESRCMCFVMYNYKAKQCALIHVEDKYNSLREQLFNLRACKVIISAETYLTRLGELNEIEQKVKQQIEDY